MKTWLPAFLGHSVVTEQTSNKVTNIHTPTEDRHSESFFVSSVCSKAQLSLVAAITSSEAKQRMWPL